MVAEKTKLTLCYLKFFHTRKMIEHLLKMSLELRNTIFDKQKNV